MYMVLFFYQGTLGVRVELFSSAPCQFPAGAVSEAILSPQLHSTTVGLGLPAEDFVQSRAFPERCPEIPRPQEAASAHRGPGCRSASTQQGLAAAELPAPCSREGRSHTRGPGRADPHPVSGSHSPEGSLTSLLPAGMRQNKGSDSKNRVWMRGGREGPGQAMGPGRWARLCWNIDPLLPRGEGRVPPPCPCQNPGRVLPVCVHSDTLVVLWSLCVCVSNFTMWAMMPNMSGKHAIATQDQSGFQDTDVHARRRRRCPHGHPLPQFTLRCYAKHKPATGLAHNI